MPCRNFLTAALLAAVVAGCAAPQPHYMDPDNDRGPISMSLDYRDFNKAAQSAIDELLEDPTMNRRDGGRTIIAIGRISNRTMQSIDTDSVIKKIRVALNRSGKAATSTTIGHGGPESGAASMNASLRSSANFDQRTVAATGGFVAPEYELTGKFLQRTVRTGKNHQQVEYRFQLTLTHLETGLAYFEHEKEIIKRGTNDTVVW